MSASVHSGLYNRLIIFSCILISAVVPEVVSTSRYWHSFRDNGNFLTILILCQANLYWGRPSIPLTHPCRSAPWCCNGAWRTRWSWPQRTSQMQLLSLCIPTAHLFLALPRHLEWLAIKSCCYYCYMILLCRSIEASPWNFRTFVISFAWFRMRAASKWSHFEGKMDLPHLSSYFKMHCITDVAASLGRLEKVLL